MKDLINKKDIIGDNRQITSARTFIVFGFPIETDDKRYDDLLDNKDEQKEFVSEFLLEIYQEYKEY